MSWWTGTRTAIVWNMANDALGAHWKKRHS